MLPSSQVGWGVGLMQQGVVVEGWVEGGYLGCRGRVDTWGAGGRLYAATNPGRPGRGQRGEGGKEGCVTVAVLPRHPLHAPLPLPHLPAAPLLSLH